MATNLKFSITPSGEVTDQTTKTEPKQGSKTGIALVTAGLDHIVHGLSILELSEQPPRSIQIRRDNDGTIHLGLEE